MNNKITIMAAISLIAANAYAHTDINTTEDNMAADSVQLSDITVLATRVPMPADKAVRIVQTIDRAQIEASAVQSVNDLLKLAAGVDVRQRGPFGIQTDIGINGGNADQLTVLLNGVNISNPHTGHLTVDLPTTVDDIERIEVIEGGASRVYGSQAFSGAINIVTRQSDKTSVGIHLCQGSFNTSGAEGNFNLHTGNVTNYVSGGYSRSDGMDDNSDFKKGRVFLNGKWQTDMFDLKWMGGISTMDYGANTFYGTGSKSQYEENRRYITAIQGEYKGRVHILPQLYWTRSLDHYVWTRSNPEAYQNFHQTNVFGANVNAYTKWSLGTTALGFEFRRENILSTRLGHEIEEGKTYRVPGTDYKYKYKDGRSNIGIYLEHNVELGNVNVSLGLLANKNTGIADQDIKFFPGIDASWRVTDNLRLYASFNQSLRVPTYTDLYYDGPGIKGNLDLKPERSTDYSLGANFRTGALKAQVKGFYRHGTDMIDWVRYTGATVHTTANSDIDNLGAEAFVTYDFMQQFGTSSILRTASLSYCYNHQYRTGEDQTAKYESQLIFLRHKLVASLSHRIVCRLSAQWDLTFKDRAGEFGNAITGMTQSYGSFCNLDLKLQWTAPSYTLYVQGNNLTNRRYYDIANVQQPGFWLMGGVKLRL